MNKFLIILVIFTFIEGIPYFLYKIGIFREEKPTES